MVATDGDLGRGSDKQIVFEFNMWTNCNERPSVAGVSTRSGNGVPSRKGLVVKAQMPKASNKEDAPPPILTSPFPLG